MNKIEASPFNPFRNVEKRFIMPLPANHPKSCIYRRNLYQK